MMNLMLETEAFLREHGKVLDDVAFIVGNGHEISKLDFVRIASGFNYEEGYGHQYVPDDLKIVGDGWWGERYEYDGSECWMFVTPPESPGAARKLLAIDGDEFGTAKYIYNTEGGAE